MAEKTLLLGIDFGTGGCKVTAIDTGGTVIGEASVEYPRFALQKAMTS